MSHDWCVPHDEHQRVQRLLFAAEDALAAQRERIAQAIEASVPGDILDRRGATDAYIDAARIARDTKTTE